MNRSLFFLVLIGLFSCAGDNPIAEDGDAASTEQVDLSTRSIPIIEKAGLRFRDLNKNARLDPYEDWRLSADDRADDLLGRMTIEEKAGQLAHGNIFPGGPFDRPPETYNRPAYEKALSEDHITAFIPFVSLDVEKFASENNLLQEAAENGRLGIPATVSTDPRHHFMSLVGASSAGEGYSQWPEPLGFAAIGDPELTKAFGEIARREYRATGFNQALSPQADLATEPRWSRIYHTFGENPEIASQMVAAYIEGFQGSKNGVERGAVSSVVKHWVGYGAAKDGLDSHNYYGRFADLLSDDLDTHVYPFLQAFDIGVSGVMPAYSIFEGLQVDGKEVEPVGAAYSGVLIDYLLRQKYGYDGVVLSDWTILNDCNEVCRSGAAPGSSPNPMTDLSTGWGVQDISIEERVALAMEAGVDQFGGLNETGPILRAVELGLITERRLDQSVRRILRTTIAKGLLENPFVDVGSVSKHVNSADVAALGLQTQSRSMVVLKKDETGLKVDEAVRGSIFSQYGRASF